MQSPPAAVPSQHVISIQVVGIVTVARARGHPHWQNARVSTTRTLGDLYEQDSLHSASHSRALHRRGALMFILLVERGRWIWGQLHRADDGFRWQRGGKWGWDGQRRYLLRRQPRKRRHRGERRDDGLRGNWRGHGRFRWQHGHHRLRRRDGSGDDGNSHWRRRCRHRIGWHGQGRRHGQRRRQQRYRR
jgi:hypothetical protein